MVLAEPQPCTCSHRRHVVQAHIKLIQLEALTGVLINMRQPPRHIKFPMVSFCFFFTSSSSSALLFCCLLLLLVVLLLIILLFLLLLLGM